MADRLDPIAGRVLEITTRHVVMPVMPAETARNAVVDQTSAAAAAMMTTPVTVSRKAIARYLHRVN